MIIINEIKNYLEIIIELLQRIGKLPEFEIAEIKVEVNFDSKFQEGRYSSDVAYRVFDKKKKYFNSQKVVYGFNEYGEPLFKEESPETIAWLLVKYLNDERIKIFDKENFEMIKAENGFINFYLSDKLLLENLKEIIKYKNDYGKQIERKAE